MVRLVVRLEVAQIDPINELSLLNLHFLFYDQLVLDLNLIVSYIIRLELTNDSIKKNRYEDINLNYKTVSDI